MRSLKVLVCAGLFMAAGVSMVFAMGDASYIQQTLIGKPAVDFTLPTVQGNTVNMTKFRGGKKAVIFVWATWCPHCRTELNRLSGLREELVAKGIQMIVVSLGEDKGTVQNYLERYRYDLDILLDEDQSLADPYRIIGVPTLFFVDEKGIIKRVDHSFPDNYEEAFK